MENTTLRVRASDEGAELANISDIVLVQNHDAYCCEFIAHSPAVGFVAASLLDTQGMSDEEWVARIDAALAGARTP